MAVLRGEEARAWLAANPNKAYKNLTSGQSVAAQPSALMKILQGITKPFRMGAGVASDFGSTIGQLSRMAKGDTSSQELDPLFWLTEEENRQLREDPLRAGLKAGAGVAAYGVPAGGGAAASTLGRVGTAAGRGAGAGALGGFGASEEGNELGGTLTGGALGGVIGGTIQGVGEGVRAIKNAKAPRVAEMGLETRGKAIGLDPNRLASKRGVNVDSATSGKKVIKSYFDSMDELGLPTNTSELASESSDKALELYRSQFDDILKGVDQTKRFTNKDTNKIINEIQGAFKNNEKVINSASYQELIRDLKGLGNSYSPSQLNIIREKARDSINWASRGKSTSAQRGTEQVFDVIDDFFKGNVNGSSEVLSKQRDIYTVRPFFQIKAPTAGSVKVGTASTNIAVPSGAIQERIPEFIGRTMQKAPVQGATSNELPQILEMLMKTGRKSIPAIPAMGSMGGQEPTSDLGFLQQEPQQGGIDEMAIVQAVLNGEMSVTEAKFIMDTLGGASGGKLSKDQANAQAAMQSLDTMESIMGSDSGALIKTYLPFQGFDENAQVLEQAALNIEDVIARMRTGAVINDEEAKRYRKMIPRITDTQQTKIQKIQQLRNIFGSILNQQGESTQDSALMQMLGL